MPQRLARRRGPWHWLFEGGITLKGLMGAAEASAGMALLLTSPARIHGWIETAARWELIEARRGPLWHRALHAAEAFSASSQHFYAIYLLLHGVMKLVMVGLLWARVAFAYPAAIVIQTVFVIFEFGRWWAEGNPALLGLAMLDLAIIGLIWHEWRYRAPQPG